MKEKTNEDNRLFKGMSEKERASCLSALHAQERSYKKGSMILQAGDSTSRMGMVLTGSVTVESNDIWGNRTILSHVGKGGYFAETYALLPEERMMVDVRANEDSCILFLDIGGALNKVSFESWKEKLLKNILIISSHKNLILSGRSFHTAPKSCRGRLLSYLNTVALQEGSAEFTIPFNRQQLADYLNLERTNMSKELSRMKRDGMIECRKSHFKLIKQG